MSFNSKPQADKFEVSPVSQLSGSWRDATGAYSPSYYQREGRGGGETPLWTVKTTCDL